MAARNEERLNRPVQNHLDRCLNSYQEASEQLPLLRSVAMSGAWETLLVGRPRHEDGGGVCRPPLPDAASPRIPASDGLALLRLFGFSFRTEKASALR